MPHVKRNTGIYCIENRINGKKYVGQAYNIERRLYEHQYYLQRGGDKCAALQRAINKYGYSNFDFYILETCEAEQLNEREMFWISELGTHKTRNGYNIAAGGRSGLIGYKWPEEFGRKVSMAKKGMKLSEETKRKISIATKGKFVSEETKKKISAGLSGENHYLYGKTITEEHRESLRKAHGGTNAYQFGKKSPNASSKYFGVGKIQRHGHTYWSVNIKKYGKRIHVGASKDEIEAAKMYDAYVIENNLPNPLNFEEK